jgi:subtilase family serine protease
LKSPWIHFASLTAVLLVAGCGSGGTSTAVPASPLSGQSTQAQSIAGRSTAAQTVAVPGNGLGEFVAPNVRAVCPQNVAPGTAHCDALIRTDVGGGALPDAVSYRPSDLQSAYKLPSSTRGSGQTIAIVDAFDDPNAEADLAVYRSQYGLPACSTSNGCFKKLNQAGNPGPYPTGNVGWAEEMSLDVDMVSAVCPSCHIMLVEGNDNSFASLGAAVDMAVKKGANAVSNSYGGQGGTASDYNHRGVIITASSGDNGYAAGTQGPAWFPTVVSLGGTSLKRATNSRGWSETVWNGTGSGCSTQSKPSWQTDSGCSGRTLNDVAAVADPNTGVVVYDSYGISPGFYVFGGTSVSSPLVAGVYGLAGNEASLNAGQSLYTKGEQLYDVTKGSNGTCSPAYLCTAEDDYDGPTGNGTPHGITSL